MPYVPSVRNVPCVKYGFTLLNALNQKIHSVVSIAPIHQIKIHFTSSWTSCTQLTTHKTSANKEKTKFIKSLTPFNINHIINFEKLTISLNTPPPLLNDDYLLSSWINKNIITLLKKQPTSGEKKTQQKDYLAFLRRLFKIFLSYFVCGKRVFLTPHRLPIGGGGGRGKH